MVQSDQKTCGKDGVHPQCAFVKLGGYAFSTFSIWPYLTTSKARSKNFEWQHWCVTSLNSHFSLSLTYFVLTVADHVFVAHHFQFV